VHAFNDHVIELNDDYDIQSMELEELEELEESEESEKSSWGNSSKNKHCVLFMKVLLIEPQLFYSSRLLSNQKEIHTPPPEFC
jgi:hypothetical protein